MQCRHTRWWHCIEFALTRPTYAASEHSMPPFPSSPTPPPPPLSLSPLSSSTARSRLRTRGRRSAILLRYRRPPLAAPQLPPGAWCPLALRRRRRARAVPGRWSRRSGSLCPRCPRAPRRARPHGVGAAFVEAFMPH
ncbi:hypothetical protein PAHAL_6G023500 [Panicum hallii]|uniref:Uncharacterized protein n=1 Tax=Panicum hallii TaxID=206008 RepID=A0A2T8IEX4_9POAL|nr:hypothetical protein PAHAL_6G023500 [Panicum hallii]